MFGDLNRVEIIGNMTQDPDLRYTPNGAAVTSFGVATNRRWKGQGEGGDWQEETQFHNIVVWGKQAEGLAQRAKKGTRLFIAGRLSTRNWEDKDGKKNYKTEIVAGEIILIDRYEKGSMGEMSAPAASSSTPTQEEDKPAKPKAAKASKSEEIDPDDLPF